MLSAAQAGTRLACDASRDTGQSLDRLTEDGLLRPAKHRFYRASESDHPPWDSRVGSSHLGDGAAVPTSVSSPGVVARLLSFCTSSCLAASGTCAATSTRG